nr:MbcA/ParS/Xre antitoxin family protein [Salinibacter ruber]
MGKTDRSRLRRSVIEIVALTCHASNGVESARQWLRAPHALLEDASPLEQMDTIVGMEEVTTMLAHVEHGRPV